MVEYVEGLPIQCAMPPPRHAAAHGLEKEMHEQKTQEFSV